MVLPGDELEPLEPEEDFDGCGELDDRVGRGVPLVDVG